MPTSFVVSTGIILTQDQQREDREINEQYMRYRAPLQSELAREPAAMAAAAAAAAAAAGPPPAQPPTRPIPAATCFPNVQKVCMPECNEPFDDVCTQTIDSFLQSL